MIVLPLFLWRAREAARWVAAGALAQTVTLIVAPRFAAVGRYDVPMLARIAVTRGFVEPLAGVTWLSFLVERIIPAWLAVLLAAGVLAATSVVIARLPRSAVIGGAYVAVATIVAGLVGTADRGPVFLIPGLAQRYFLVSGALLAAAIVISFWRRPGPLALGLVAILVCSAVADFEIPSWPANRRTAASACIGGPAPCVVPVEPAQLWSIRWPGVAGVYDQRPIGR